MEITTQFTDILDRACGTWGIAAWNLETDEQIMINDRQVFPSASVIKVPMLAELYCQRDEGKVSLDEIILLRDEDKVDGSGVLKELHAGLELTILDLAVLMIVVSDNTATNMLMERIGIDSVNARMKSLGLEQTVLARKMYDFEQAKLGKENLCSPHDLMLLLKQMVDGRISSKSTSTEMLEIMARQHSRDKIPLLLPEGTKIAAKAGGIPGVSHDVAVVYTSKQPYILCVMTKDIADRIDANRAIGEVSLRLYQHFCP